MSTIGDRIKALRKSKGWTQKDLADQLGWVHTRLTNYENGARAPRVEYLHQLAKLFDTPIGVLLGTQSMEKSEAEVVRDSVPIIDWLNVRKFISGDRSEAYTIGRIRPNYGPNMRPNAFAVKIETDSMIGSGIDSFAPGSVVICDNLITPKSGLFVIASENNESTPMLRRLISEGGSWFLQPLNPTYPSIQIQNLQNSVLATAVEWVRCGAL
jgi:SOS-response transcriptional repressor LexA